MDLYIFNIINGLAGKWVCLDGLAIFFAKYFEYALILFLIVLLVVNFKKHWRIVLVSLASAAISRFVLATLIRVLWFRPRPFVSLNFIPLINQSPAEASFPSGHASFYFALSTVVFLYNKKIGIFFYISSFLIVLARVFIGIHWPSDILAGALIGILTGWIGYKISKKYLKQ